MNVQSIIESIKLTESERKVLKSCRAKLDQLTETSALYHPAEEALAEGKRSGLLDRIYTTGDSFIADPSPENYEAHLTALLLNEVQKANRGRLRDLGMRVVEDARSPLAAICSNVLDKAERELERQAADSAVHAEKAGMTGEHHAKVQACREVLRIERDSARENPAAWLANYGHEL